MIEKRPYIIVLAFVVGAVLTPPDPVSQTLLAVPIWMLFELGLFFSRFFKRDEADEQSPHELLENTGGKTGQQLGNHDD
jgi:sec-independent protein translocase protein TatC